MWWDLQKSMCSASRRVSDNPIQKYPNCQIQWPFLVLIKNETTFDNVDYILLSPPLVSVISASPSVWQISLIASVQFPSDSSFPRIPSWLSSHLICFLWQSIYTQVPMLTYTLKSITIRAGTSIFTAVIFWPWKSALQRCSYLSIWYPIHSTTPSRNLGDVLHFPSSHLISSQSAMNSIPILLSVSTFLHLFKTQFRFCYSLNPFSGSH